MKARITWGIAGALIALVVSLVALAGAPMAIATDGEPVVYGYGNNESKATIFCLGPNSNGCSGDAAVAGVALIAGSDGLYGQSNVDGNGVFGRANNSGASGVYGQNDGTGYGVAGRASSGTGILGDSANGTGVWADSQNATALKVSGKAQFSRSGVVTIAYPAKSATVSGVAVIAKSMVLATMQTYLAGRYVAAAVPNLGGSSNSLTIYLNKAPGTSTSPKSVKVAWQVIERP